MLPKAKVKYEASIHKLVEGLITMFVLSQQKFPLIVHGVSAQNKKSISWRIWNEQ